MAIIADVRTGDILAMATVDGRPTRATRDRDATRGPAPASPRPSTEHNRPLTDVFEPGSTNKVVTIAAAIEAGLVKPDTVLDVPQHDQGRRHRSTPTSRRTPPELTVADILRESSNVGTILIAGQLGATRFDAAAARLRLRQADRARLPGRGARHHPAARASTTTTSLASMPIGNGIAVTAMQMLDVYIDPRQRRRRPRRRASSPRRSTSDGNAPRPPARRDPPGRVSSDTATPMRQMLAGVVADRDRHQGRDPGLHRRPARPGPPASRPTTAAVPVRGLVRRVRAGREPPAGDDRRARRARERPDLRRRGRRAGVLPDHAVRPGGRAGAGFGEAGRYPEPRLTVEPGGRARARKATRARAVPGAPRRRRGARAPG